MVYIHAHEHPGNIEGPWYAHVVQKREANCLHGGREVHHSRQTTIIFWCAGWALQDLRRVSRRLHAWRGLHRAAAGGL